MTNEEKIIKNKAGLEVDLSRFDAKGGDVKYYAGRYGPTCAGFQFAYPGWTGTDNDGLKL